MCASCSWPCPSNKILLIRRIPGWNCLDAETDGVSCAVVRKNEKKLVKPKSTVRNFATGCQAKTLWGFAVIGVGGVRETCEWKYKCHYIYPRSAGTAEVDPKAATLEVHPSFEFRFGLPDDAGEETAGCVSCLCDLPPFERHHVSRHGSQTEAVPVSFSAAGSAFSRSHIQLWVSVVTSNRSHRDARGLWPPPYRMSAYSQGLRFVTNSLPRTSLRSSNP